jgi:hypothetical protein
VHDLDAVDADVLEAFIAGAKQYEAEVEQRAKEARRG